MSHRLCSVVIVGQFERAREFTCSRDQNFTTLFNNKATFWALLILVSRYSSVLRTINRTHAQQNDKAFMISCVPTCFVAWLCARTEQQYYQCLDDKNLFFAQKHLLRGTVSILLINSALVSRFLTLFLIFVNVFCGLEKSS